MIQARKLQERFHQIYGGPSNVYRAPGRVNLIGEHTDYNDGFVMPAAINFYTWIAAAPRNDRRVCVHSENFSEDVEFSLDDPQPQRRGHWSDYPRGVAVTLEQAGCRLRGANLAIHGEVPLGSGLSSSAAIEVATGYALLANSGRTANLVKLAQVCQRAENEFVGMRCGIMDQFISCCGKAGHVLRLDCRTLEFRLAPLPPGVTLVIVNSMVRHELAGGEYNKRREECEVGVRYLAGHLPQIRALRDVTLGDLERYGSGLPKDVYRRCRHVITENVRVAAAEAALEHGDLSEFGRLMSESHRSLRDDYAVSCSELDLLVSLAHKIDGVYGARMTGGGFGGCTINLVQSDRVADFRNRVGVEYQRATGRTPEIYVSQAADGVQAVTSAN